MSALHHCPPSPNQSHVMAAAFHSHSTNKATKQVDAMDTKVLTIRTLVSSLTSPSEQTRLAALRHLHRISNEDPSSRPLIAAAADNSAFPLLTSSLYSPSHSIQDHAAATLLNLSISPQVQRPLLSSPSLLPALSHVLSRHRSSSSPSAVQSSAATLHSLLSTTPDSGPLIAANLDLLRALVDIIATPHSPTRSVKDALRASFAVVLYPPSRTIMIRLGAIPALFGLLDLLSKRSKTGMIEDATAVIAQVAGCEESEEAFRKVSGIPALAGLFGLNSGSCGTGASLRTKENVVSGLLNLVRCGGERVVGEVRERAEVLDGIVYVQEHGSAKGKSKAVALLKLLLDDGGSSNKIVEDLYPVETES